MFLKLSDIIKRIGVIQTTGMNQAHEHIADIGTMFCFVKQGVFSVANAHLESLFTNIVYGCRAMHPVEKVIQNTSQ